MIKHQCAACATDIHLPEINDRTDVDPKFKYDELVSISGHGLAMFRIVKLDKLRMTLEIV